ncbi:MAG: dihydrodipicolinate synthase family protein [Fodinibius sp.]|nr:dihydrodipicolinate synthase family protein [Fodinibius sp.]
MSLTDTSLYTALVTPMKENGDLHLDNLASLIRRQDDAGNGVLILGSTGEGLNLPLEDKKSGKNGVEPECGYSRYGGRRWL